MNCAERYYEIRASVPATVKIVAVSKTKPVAMIDEIYTLTGHKIFGENKVQELSAKFELLPKDIDWHFIGHLQTNKIKFIAPYIGLIQSVDSFRLLTEINREAKKCNRIIPCLLEFHIASEQAKSGYTIAEAKSMLDNVLFQELTNVSVNGVMGMATFTSDEHQVRSEFQTLYSYFTSLKTSYFSQQAGFCEVSMGMTDDYRIAVGEGSTIIRIGSGIFGDR
ncbi:MAG: YggS family pyridoxal phosphate-dependent enzyme [Bacteroidota bacterium]